MKNSSSNKNKFRNFFSSKKNASYTLWKRISSIIIFFLLAVLFIIANINLAKHEDDGLFAFIDVIFIFCLLAWAIYYLLKYFQTHKKPLLDNKESNTSQEFDSLNSTQDTPTASPFITQTENREQQQNNNNNNIIAHNFAQVQDIQ